MSAVKFIVENPEKTELHRNRNANRSLKINDTIYRVHKELLKCSEVLGKLVKESDRTLLRLDHLTADQENFTPCGLDIALDWLYGKRVEFTDEQLPDALAAAFALKMYDMIHAIEEAVLNHIGDPFALTILLYHIDNFTPETRKQILKSAAAEIGEVSRLRPFVGCPSSTFRRLMKVAIRNVGDSVNAMDVIEAILIWATENVENDLVVSLLQQIPIDDLSTDEMDMLSEFAIDCGLGRLMTVVTNRFYALNTSSLSQRLDFEESENLEGYVEEQKAAREDRNGKRIAAGKNVTSTRTTQDKTEVKEEPAGIRIIATPEDRQYIRKIMEKTEAVYFGAVPLEKSNNDLHIEITYQGPKEAAKDDPVKLYFDFEIDPPVTVS